jgi:hypothetical protein
MSLPGDCSRRATALRRDMALTSDAPESIRLESGTARESDTARDDASDQRRLEFETTPVHDGSMYLS